VKQVLVAVIIDMQMQIGSTDMAIGFVNGGISGYLLPKVVRLGVRYIVEK
jgi:uncharacterized membrane protein (Fun14 family)